MIRAAKFGILPALSLCFMWLISATTAAAPSPSPADFFATVQKVRQALVQGRYDRAVAIDEGFAKRFPHGSYAAMAMLEIGIVASWCLNDTARAGSTFRRAVQAAGKDEPGKRCADIARRHLAKSQLVRVKAALRKYYTKKIEFPTQVSALVDRQLLAKEDSATPWGTPWHYERRASDLFPDIEGQEYTLYSRELGKDPLPAPKLKQQWLSLSRRFALWAAGSQGAGGSLARIEYLEAGVRSEKRKITLKQGERLEGLELIHVATEGAVLASPDFLVLLPLRIRGR